MGSVGGWWKGRGVVDGCVVGWEGGRERRARPVEVTRWFFKDLPSFFLAQGIFPEKGREVNFPMIGPNRLAENLLFTIHQFFFSA